MFHYIYCIDFAFKQLISSVYCQWVILDKHFIMSKQRPLEKYVLSQFFRLQYHCSMCCSTQSDHLALKLYVVASILVHFFCFSLSSLTDLSCKKPQSAVLRVSRTNESVPSAPCIESTVFAVILSCKS